MRYWRNGRKKIDSVRGIKEMILDIDSSESPVYGEQEGSNYNGHFLSKCYHPLFVFNQHGDCLKAKLRPGNAHSADGWEEFLEPVLRHYAGKGISVKVRGDAAFAIPGLYELCEELGIDYAVRIKENKKLAEKLEKYTRRPAGRPGKDPVIKYVSFRYRAGKQNIDPYFQNQPVVMKPEGRTKFRGEEIQFLMIFWLTNGIQ